MDVIFEQIDGNRIQEACKKLDGSGGPTLVDADLFKHMICSKAFGKLSTAFADEIAMVTKRLCTENIPHEYMRLLLDSRLIPLIKDTVGVRPIGIGELLRRVMGKSVAMTVGEDVQMAGGILQTCIEGLSLELKQPYMEWLAYSN